MVYSGVLPRFTPLPLFGFYTIYILMMSNYAHSPSCRKLFQGNILKRSRKSVALAASPSRGVTPNISWMVSRAEMWVCGGIIFYVGPVVILHQDQDDGPLARGSCGCRNRSADWGSWSRGRSKPVRGGNGDC